MGVSYDAVLAALHTVIDPELDQPITDLGFIASLQVSDDRVEAHLRLPTSFCSPNFAWLMVSDAYDAIAGLGVGTVVVELDDHHDSDLINRGLAAVAGYRGTFGHEAVDSLDELRRTFQRKAHTAAMERALTAHLKSDPAITETDLFDFRLCDLPAAGPETGALLRRRATLGLPVDGEAPVLVDDDGVRPTRDKAVLLVRRARSVRISVDGNAHFCRGLLGTRYPGARPLLPLSVQSREEVMS